MNKTNLNYPQLVGMAVLIAFKQNHQAQKKQTLSACLLVLNGVHQ